MTLTKQLQTYIRRRAVVESVRCDTPLEVFEQAALGQDLQRSA